MFPVHLAAKRRMNGPASASRALRYSRAYSEFVNLNLSATFTTVNPSEAPQLQQMLRGSNDTAAASFAGVSVATVTSVNGSITTTLTSIGRRLRKIQEPYPTVRNDPRTTRSPSAVTRCLNAEGSSAPAMSSA